MLNLQQLQTQTTHDVPAEPTPHWLSCRAARRDARVVVQHTERRLRRHLSRLECAKCLSLAAGPPVYFHSSLLIIRTTGAHAAAPWLATPRARSSAFGRSAGLAWVRARCAGRRAIDAADPRCSWCTNHGWLTPLRSTRACRHTLTESARSARHLAGARAVADARVSTADGGAAEGDAQQRATGSKRSRPEDDADGMQPGAKRARLDESGGNNGASATAPGAGSKHTPPLSVDDEQLVLRAAELETWRVCMAAGFDRAVAATAVCLLKRLYVNTPLTDYPPAEMM
jgi:hypothetical protein